jgi:hypothetical protein
VQVHVGCHEQRERKDSEGPDAPNRSRQAEDHNQDHGHFEKTPPLGLVLLEMSEQDIAHGKDAQHYGAVEAARRDPQQRSDKGWLSRSLRTPPAGGGVGRCMAVTPSARAGEKNFVDEQIANLDESTAHWIKLSANEDGSFQVMNGRTGVWKSDDIR